MALFSSITGDWGRGETDTQRTTEYWNPQQKKTSKTLYSTLIKPGMKSSPFTGQPTDIEQTAIGQLQSYGQQTPQYMGDASGALSRALTGQGYQSIVDPSVAEKLYGAIQDRTMQDILPEVMRNAAQTANIGGMLHSGTGQKLMTDEMGRIARALSEQLAGLKYQDELQRRDIAREREGRQLQAVPQVGGLSAAEFGRIMPGLQYGGIERDIAGTQFNNPLTNLALAFLGLRGQEESKGRATTTNYGFSGRAGVEFPNFGVYSKTG